MSYQKENESKRKTVECGSLNKGYDLQGKKKYLKSKKHCSIQISGIEKKRGKPNVKMTKRV